MVTKLSDGRGQVTIKAHAVTDEWERLVKAAAQGNGQTVADFIVSITTDAAQKILKGESAVPAALPARPEEVADVIATRAAELMTERIEERLAEIRLANRRGRWRVR